MLLVLDALFYTLIISLFFIVFSVVLAAETTRGNQRGWELRLRFPSSPNPPLLSPNPTLLLFPNPPLSPDPPLSAPSSPNPPLSTDAPLSAPSSPNPRLLSPNPTLLFPNPPLLFPNLSFFGF